MNSLISHIEKPIIKLTGQVEQLSLNGGMLIDMATLTNKTLYTSPFMVITDQEYTKHYYAGTQRIASKLGGGFELASVNPTDDNHDLAPITSYTSIPEFYDQKKAGLMELLSRSWDCVNMQGYASIEGEQLLSIEELQNSNNPENEMFFYHTDHLGSSSWISDASGNAYQHLQYMPYGEQFIEQRQSTWGTPYQFTGKELDSETGYSYFGARYYDSDLSVWLSVDPLSDMYPSTSGYMYVLGRPTALIDPNGMNSWVPPTSEGGAWTAEAGDGAWDLYTHPNNTASWDEVKGAVRGMNEARGESREFMVHPGDQVTLPGGGASENNSSSSSAVDNSTPSTSTNSNTSTSSSSPATDALNDFNNFVLSPSSAILSTKVGLKYTPSNILRTGYWTGANGRNYSMNLTKPGVQGNVFYRGSMNIAKNSVLQFGRYAKGFGYLSLAVSGYNLIENPSFESSLDFGVGITSLIFWEAAPIYFGAKGFYLLTENQTQFYIQYGINPGNQVIFFKE
jgi:RHS repeat-associated protein